MSSLTIKASRATPNYEEPEPDPLGTDGPEEAAITLKDYLEAGQVAIDQQSNPFEPEAMARFDAEHPEELAAWNRLMHGIKERQSDEIIAALQAARGEHRKELFKKALVATMAGTVAVLTTLLLQSHDKPTGEWLTKQERDEILAPFSDDAKEPFVYIDDFIEKP